MIDFATLASIVTVLAVVAFAGILAWTLSSRQDRRFETASRLPFELPDEVAGTRQNIAETGEGR